MPEHKVCDNTSKKFPTITKNYFGGENMKLLIKQRVFSWTDTYDVYDEYGNVKYFVKAEAFRLTHQLHIYDSMHNEIGMIKQRFFTLMPTFDIEINGQMFGSIEKQFTFFKPKYSLDYNGWRCDGDFMAWNYRVYEACCTVATISKEPLHWGDTYVIDFINPRNEILVLMLAVAIDAANCSQNK
ncbi:LURP-one-related/scramblase family protein [Ruminococcus sp.]|uniref:LURP-one-related/scramblase family protein n=1 Tax=Ruminococcus sp. TaxID=41978 RepID=UPI0038653E5D